MWEARYDLTAKLLYGEAFRAPSFTEQYGINPVSNGNPGLMPETIRTLEAALSWRSRLDTQVNLNVFRYQIENMIRVVPNTVPAIGATFLNTGGQRGHGVELEAVWDASHSLRLTGNYAFQQSTDETSGQDAGYAPHHQAYLRGDWRFAPGWFSSLQAKYVADRKRAAGDTRPQIPDYTTVDLTLRNTKSRQWEFSGSIRNLFNATVLEPSLAPGLVPGDFPQARRNFWLQAIYRP